MNRKLLLKQVIITSILSLFFLNIAAQAGKSFQFKGSVYTVKSSVLSYLGKEKVDEYAEKAPLKLMYYNFYSSNSYLIINELPKKSGVIAEELKNKSGQNFIGNETDFDIFKTTIEISDKNQFFKLNDKYIMVYPQSTIDKDFDAFIESLSK